MSSLTDTLVELQRMFITSCLPDMTYVDGVNVFELLRLDKRMMRMFRCSVIIMHDKVLVVSLLCDTAAPAAPAAGLVAGMGEVAWKINVYLASSMLANGLNLVAVIARRMATGDTGIHEILLQGQLPPPSQLLRNAPPPHQHCDDDDDAAATNTSSTGSTTTSMGVEVGDRCYLRTDPMAKPYRLIYSPPPPYSNFKNIRSSFSKFRVLPSKVVVDGDDEVDQEQQPHEQQQRLYLEVVRVCPEGSGAFEVRVVGGDHGSGGVSVDVFSGGNDETIMLRRAQWLEKMVLESVEDVEFESDLYTLK